MLCNFIRRTVTTWQLRSSRAVFGKSRQESGFKPIRGKKLLSVHSDDGKKTSLSQEVLINININMRWILQPLKISASIFFHGRQSDLQTGRQSAPAGPAALVVVRNQMHQTQQRCPLPSPMRPAYSRVQFNQEPSPPHRTNSTPSFSSPVDTEVKPNQHDVEERRITQPVYPILDSLAQSAGSSIPAWLFSDRWSSLHQVSSTATISDRCHNLYSPMKTILKNRDFLLNQLIVFCPIFQVFASKFGQNLTEVIAWTAWLCAVQFLRRGPT